VEGRVLIIEGRAGNRELLRERFEEAGIEVSEATTGAEGIKAAIRFMPQVILLSTSLPDIPGVLVAERLRAINRTKHVFLMMVGDEHNRQERLMSLDVGANDFVDSPFDPDLVTLRVRNAINRRNMEDSTDPVTGMPAGRRIQDEMLNLLRHPEGDWALMRFRLLAMEPFREVYGFTAGDALLSGAARILAEALSCDDVEGDFLGFGGHDDFIVITHKDRAVGLEAEVLAQFEQEVGSYYEFTERKKGSVKVEGQQFPLVTMHVRCITPEDGPFYDIRSLSEALTG
jgi:PleD family two-component response regulator